jgi:hypothetical protein
LGDRELEEEDEDEGVGDDMTGRLMDRGSVSQKQVEDKSSDVDSIISSGALDYDNKVQSSIHCIIIILEMRDIYKYT